ncbi:MAG: hypothetical protein AB4352_05525 [Hormoscilla sp.]
MGWPMGSYRQGGPGADTVPLAKGDLPWPDGMRSAINCRGTAAGARR